jgi:N-acetylglucosamine malate deacetylase 1
MKNIIVLSAHPDDEVLGAGGTLLKHKASGDHIYWIIATNMAVKYGYSKTDVTRRKNEIEKVGKHLGVKKIFDLGFPPMELTSEILPSLIKQISEIFNKVKPEIVYSVHRSDAHSDHRLLAEAVFSCTKSFRYPFIKKVLMYECISETEFAPQFQDTVFIPNYFVDISEFLEKKIQVMRIYKTELGQHPFPRNEKNIEALATYRGAIAGTRFAEAFQIVKIIEK